MKSLLQYCIIINHCYAKHISVECSLKPRTLFCLKQYPQRISLMQVEIVIPSGKFQIAGNTVNYNANSKCSFKTPQLLLLVYCSSRKQECLFPYCTENRALQARGCSGGFLGGATKAIYQYFCSGIRVGVLQRHFQ